MGPPTDPDHHHHALRVRFADLEKACAALWEYLRYSALEPTEPYDGLTDLQQCRIRAAVLRGANAVDMVAVLRESR